MKDKNGFLDYLKYERNYSNNTIIAYENNIEKFKQENSIILNDVYLGDNTYIENCIVESRDTIRANTRHVGENGVKVVVEKNERYAL